MKKLLKSLVFWCILSSFFFINSALAETNKAVYGNPTPLSFNDIDQKDNNKIYINYLVNRGLVKGFPDGNFHPGAGLTRSEAVTLVVRILGLADKPGMSGFVDVTDDDDWAAGAIRAAEGAQLLKGYDDKVLRADAQITRAEFMALVLRMTKQPDPLVPLPRLEDISPDDWSARPIAIGLASGMLSLAGDNKHVLPNRPITRREMARALAVLLTKDPTLAQTALSSKLDVIKGTVTVVRANGQTFKDLSGTVEIYPGDTVQTGGGSAAQLIYPDGTGLYIQQNTEIMINGYRGRNYIKPDGSPGKAIELLSVNLKKGKIYGALATPGNVSTNKAGQAVELNDQERLPLVTILKSKQPVEKAPSLSPETTARAKKQPWWTAQQVKRVRVKVDMPWGVASIRGTFWENDVKPDGRSKTSVLTGDGEVTAAGSTVKLGANQRTEINSTIRPPAKPIPMTLQDKKDWGLVKSWVQERAQVIKINQETFLSGSQYIKSPDITEVINKALLEAEKKSEPSKPVPKKTSGVRVSGVALNHSSLSLKLGGAPAALTVRVSPVGATNKSVVWSSDIPTVAKVNSKGVVTPVGPGTSRISVKTLDGGFTASCTVIVQHW